jgi:LysR family nitrogen assimilation transcriptional regulator
MAIKTTRTRKSSIADEASRYLLDSRKLFFFLRVAQAGSFTVAEAQLDVSQSTLTRQIQHLEDEVGAQLLQRTGRGVVLTPSGETLLTYAEAILGNMNSAIEAIDRSQRSPMGEISIAAPYMFATLYMPEVIKRILQKHPTLKLNVMEGSTGHVHERLASGEVDAAVLVIAPTNQKLLTTHILTERLCLMVRHDHQLATACSVSREQLVDQNLILPAALHGSRTIINQYFEEAGIKLDIQVNADSLVLTKALIAQDPKYVSILPERACRPELEAGLLKAIPLRPLLHRSLYLARPRERPPNPFLKDLIAEIETVIQFSNSPQGGPESNTELDQQGSSSRSLRKRQKC